MRTINLTLDGELGHMDLAALSTSIDALISMLKSLTPDGEEIAASLIDLQSGSAVVKIAAPDEQVTSLIAGLSSLSHTASMPRGWNHETLNGLRDLRRASQHPGITGITLATDQTTTPIDAALEENLRELTTQLTQISIGSVTGKLYRYSSRSDLEASIQPEGYAQPVTLLLDQKTATAARNTLDTRVRVWGELERLVASNVPVAMKVYGIDTLELAAPPQPTHSGRGIWKDLETSDEDSVDLVRKVRNI